MIVMKPSAVPDNGNFARASAGTYLGSDGVLKTAQTNAPRYVDGLLVMEPAATNLLLFSEQLNNAAAWNAPSTTVTANSVTAPDGALTAETVFVSGSSSGGLQQNKTVTPGAAMVLSFWAKRSSATAAGWRVYNNTAASDIVAPASYYSTISASTWTRISIAFTVPAGCTSVRVYPCADVSASGSGAHIWGVQLETGSVATSYIPTTTAAAGRAADSYTAGYIACMDIDGLAVGISPNIISETSEAPLWNGASAYVVDDLVVRTSTHRVYRRRVPGTTAESPENDPTNWQDLRSTVKYGCWDKSAATTTLGFYSLAVSWFLAGANSVSIVGAQGATASVNVTDGAGGAVLYSASKVFSDDRYSYPAWPTGSLRLVDWHLFDLPSGYPNAVVHVVINGVDGGNIVTSLSGVREIYYGAGFDIGATQYGARVSITDYSRKETDAFGTVTLVRRPFSRRLSCDIEMPLADFQKVFSLLADLRATVCQWVPEASGSYQPLMMQGWYRDFSIAVAYPTYLLCTLEVESLAVDTLIEELP